MKNKIKIAVSSPEIKLCTPEYNARVCAEAARAADASGADVIVFPELTLSGATAGDLFRFDILSEASERALGYYVEATKELEVMSFVGLPLKLNGNLYNTIACITEGEILGISVAGTLSRHFAPAPEKPFFAEICQKRVEMGRNLIYTDEDTRANIFVKVGDDAVYSKDGVNLIINPVAMAEYVGLSKERRQYAMQVSSLLETAFVVAGAGIGESGTDGIYAAPRLVCQNGEVIAEAPLFDGEILYAEIDLKRHKKINTEQAALKSEPIRFPFVPEDEKELAEDCELAIEIQARALAERIKRAYARCAVIGVSGGLDSTLAVLVAARAMDILEMPRKSVIAITMPCFGTTARTKSNALALAEELLCSVRTIDIKAAVNQHFEDISHDKDDYNVVYENAQARERTQILMDIANAEGGLVIGTGDLSELALGFATYNGDHMSMYCVNGSVPKTFMRAMIKHEAETYRSKGEERLASVLLDVINTPISPELLPIENGENNQHTENIVGPYELHDFFLYYTVKYGYSPRKILDMATSVFKEYNHDDVKRYLNIFVRRFFSQQFKRSCLPDGPRVTEISLSPRGAWQMPSDVSSELWRCDLEDNVNNE